MSFMRRSQRIAGVVAVASAALVVSALPAVGDDGAVPAVEPASADAGSTAQDPVVIGAAEPDDLETVAARVVAGMSDRERAGAVVMGHIGGSSPETLRDYLAESGAGGFLLMGNNVVRGEPSMRERVGALVDDPELSSDGAIPPLVAVDEEGGQVRRLWWDDFAGPPHLRNSVPQEAEWAYGGRGALLARSQIGVNFGIIADVTDDWSSFIRGRVLGTDPDAASERVAAAVTGEGAFALSTLKHFPGHGQVVEDSHRTIPVTDQSYDEWLETTAKPFQAGVDAGAPLVMTGHLVYSDVSEAPASLAPEWYEILRTEIGFDGVAVTDDLGMLLASGDERYSDPVGNAVAAIAAGADLVLMVQGSEAGTAGELISGITNALESGDLPEERLAEAAERVISLRLQLGASTTLLPE